MMFVKRFILLLVVASFSLVQTCAEAGEIDDLTPAISKVVSGGEWQCREDRGFFRLIVQTVDVTDADGRIRLIDKVYLQWIRVDTESHVAKVVHTTPVPEVARASSRVSDASSFGESGDKVCRIWLAITKWEDPDMLMTLTPKCDFTYDISTRPKRK